MTIDDVKKIITEGALTRKNKDKAQGLQVAEGLIILHKYNPNLRCSGQSPGSLLVCYEEEIVTRMSKDDLMELGSLGWFISSYYVSCWQTL
ncbi:hypothetical protein KJ853_00110 [Patescibacteria group bacterium]|nr:hypothetical protein [Patescibacteria group bacterium]